ncbi:MAG: cellulase family glycosylhydrolase [Phycisphaerales bacterium]|nr:MAG: cellulase family glycosylhydrolase [Phycisphaerales bacterium]
MKTRTKLHHVTCTLVFLTTTMGVIELSGEAKGSDNARLHSSATDAKLGLIRLSKDGTQFVSAESGDRFVAWGFNYDHDDAGRLLEDYWQEEWSVVVEDFNEMKDLGANLVRVHPQLGKFMEAADRPNKAALKQLGRLVDLAEKTGLYLDITGLGCYHKKDVPGWYDAMGESKRWEVQARFWEAVAKTCAQSDAVFCYDLMNEPILPGENEKETEWLAGELGGKYFVQRITLDLAGRTREQVAAAWVGKLVAAIRKHDDRHMVTVGVIPWVYTFPQAQPLFYSKKTSDDLDFVSVHFYPEKGKVGRALKALAAYDIGKPLVIEETSPLYCGIEQFDAFVDGSRKMADGYVGFYWGKTIDEYRQRKDDIPAGIMAEWLEYFYAKRSEM